MKKLRVLVLMQGDRAPPPDAEKLSPKEFEQYRADHNVLTALTAAGHDVAPLALEDELAPLREALEEHRPQIVFNLVDQFRGLATYDTNVVGYLELMRAAYTGCNPRGLILARDKALSKKILHYHRVRAPRFATFRRKTQRRPRTRLEYPLIVKPLNEEGSSGIAQASIVQDKAGLDKRVKFVHESFETAAIVEEYVEGRELYVGVWGNNRLQMLPVWEIYLDDLPDDAARIATYSVKWDLAYQAKYKVRMGPARDISDELRAQLEDTARRVYRVLGLNGYARMDFRLREDGRFFLLEANPNPDIAEAEEFASAAKQSGLSYDEILQRIMSMGMRWHEEHYV